MQWLEVGMGLARLVLTVLASTAGGISAESKRLDELLATPILGPRAALEDAIAFVQSKLPAMPTAATAQEWESTANAIREKVLAKAYFRGKAAEWRQMRTRYEWLETIEGGPGYRVRKLRYEVIPGMWIPALLYEPKSMAGKVPVHLAVNGHDFKGKSAPYKQMRCINLAKRGMPVLNLEWFGMGQLSSPGYHHGRLDQLNLCGTSGVGLFLLAMTRGIDILLEHPHADPARVAVHGLSGGGWQTITVSALDPRVTLCNPVAGYSGFAIRLTKFKDLGDSEQTPCDMATVADYTHYTAMLAPRPALLTYNSKDQCCFEAGYALEPLLEAARPVYRLFDKERHLRAHINDDPGDHNFKKDNRQALYRMVGDFFFPGDAAYSAEEIESESEIKTAETLNVELPKNNETFQTTALQLSERLPIHAEWPTEAKEAASWQETHRRRVLECVRAKDGLRFANLRTVVADSDRRIRIWTLGTANGWTIPVLEWSGNQPQSTTVLFGDGGMQSLKAQAESLIAARHRVLAVDLFYFGSAKIPERDYLIALMISTVGERPIGVQAGQLAVVCEWAKSMYGKAPGIEAVGPRSGAIGLLAAGLFPDVIGRATLENPLGSLKETLEENRSVEQSPELFCFGLLEATDLRHAAALVAPRRLTIRKPSARAAREYSKLTAWYKLLGVEHDCLAN